jgi:hypothetical protein
VRREHSFDLCRLDTDAADLDLIVQATEELQGSVGPEPAEVSTAITSSSFPDDESFRGCLWLSDISRGDSCTADEDLTGHTDGDRLQMTVDHLDASAGNRPADVNYRSRKLPGGAPDGCFSRAVFVEQSNSGQERAMLRHQLGRACLTGDDNCT